MFDPFASMTGHLMAVGDRTAEEPRSPHQPTTAFVYEYPSTLLTAAIEAHREFNHKNRQCRSRIVCAMDMQTRKVAVFPDLQVAAKALGYSSVGTLKNRTLTGYDHAKRLLLCSPGFNDTQISFIDPLSPEIKKERVTNIAHLFSYNLETGQKLLHTSIYAAAERLKLTKIAVQDLLLGGGKPRHRALYRFEVATLAAIHAFDPEYCPTHFKHQVAKTADVRSFVAGTFDAEWGLKDRGPQLYPATSWRAAKRNAGLIA